MVLASTSVLMAEQALKKTAASVSVPRVSSGCPPTRQKTLQDQQMVLTQAPFKLLLLLWVLEHVDFVGAL